MQAAAFAKAISVDVKEVSVIERVSLDSMPVEAGYDGPRLENDTDVTAEFMERLLEHYRELVNGRVGVMTRVTTPWVIIKAFPWSDRMTLVILKVNLLVK